MRLRRRRPWGDEGDGGRGGDLAWGGGDSIHSVAIDRATMPIKQSKKRMKISSHAVWDYIHVSLLRERFFFLKSC